MLFRPRRRSLQKTSAVRKHEYLMAVVGLWRNPAGSERAKGFDVGSEGTAAFDPHSLESRHSAFGQLWSLDIAKRRGRERSNPFLADDRFAGYSGARMLARLGFGAI